MGPSAGSLSTKPDPIDLRIYAGADANFTLYEDEGDNYDYEHGVYSLIPLHWDDKKEELTIGARVGVFPGMLGHRIFRVMRVNDGNGVGMDLASKPDATIQYDGKAILIQLPTSAQSSKEP
jgi:alpha-D-xyloside xylohydrolase